MNKSKLANIFPNTETLGFYDPLHQTIHIGKYKSSDYENIQPNNNQDLDKIALLEHELTHWLDHCSTLWGQKNIVMLFNAINAYANQNIDEFWRIKTLSNSFRRDVYFNYFTEQHNYIKGSETEKWKYAITSGIRFNEEGKPNPQKPILFVRFNSNDDIPISRVPLTVASILEANAIKAEYDIKMSGLKDEENIQNLKKEFIDLLYDPELTLYSVIAHLTANLNDDEDVIRIFKQTSAIGTLTLNLPEQVYENLKVPQIDHDTWKQRYEFFKADRDIGATYYFLLKNMIDLKGKKSFTEDNILSSSNLPKKDEITEIVIEEMQSNMANLIDGYFKDMAIEILTQGIEIFKNRGLFGNNEKFKENINTNNIKPTILFSDTTIINTNNIDIQSILRKLNHKDKLTISEKYFALDFYSNKIDDFIEICGI